MLKSCKYCNRVHDSKVDCGYKPKRKKLGTMQDKFRWTTEWQHKREEIKQRDMYMCQVCKRLMYPYGAPQYNTKSIEVHHIDPLITHYDRRLDNMNLISICKQHHEMAECGQINKKELFKIVKEQEDNRQPMYLLNDTPHIE